MIDKLRFLVAAAAIVASTGALASETYGLLNPPGVYFGSGNPNGNFNITYQNGLELALRAKNRSSVGPVLIDGSSGVYSVQPGFCTTCSGAPKANWNYEFSIHTTDGSKVADYRFELSVDHDPSTATNFLGSTVDPTIYWAADNATDGALGIQNSQNVAFGSTPGGAINPNAPGLYDFVLRAFSRTDNALLAEVDMSVRVPEPGSFALFGLGLAGLAALGRRKAKPAG